ncbi:LysR family transcriptional regulator [Actinomadura citrea]|uniref:DNA-binding transcriptional LysR family regulator n=1 Tax=Actinomadura citrea TaxID=46158 RepID=A0A7Y9GAT5_9ACTN|nr:LysR family transcriptional regulator [Actinomadura citrea]NYE13082.1 DNA-binding transcriptional LysR family regulator [Actinomadura citrea]GGT88565.1 transcriptional regulator [Actinomadura citrea]
MRIEQLECVAAVTRLGSMRRASEALHLSQPALSQTISNLERELGVTLLDRHRAGARISAGGRELLPWIAEVLDAVHRLRAAADDQAGSRQMIRIGTVNAATVPLVTPAMREFRAAHPATQVELVTAQQADIRDALRGGGLDLGLINVIEGDDPPPDLAAVELLRGRAVVCCRTDSPLARLDAVPLDRMLAEPFVAMRSGYLMHRYVHRLLRGREPAFAYSVDGAEMGKVMVAEGLGVTLLPDYSIADDPLELTGVITRRPLAADGPDVLLAAEHARTRHLPHHVHRMIRLLRTQAARLHPDRHAGSPGGRPRGTTSDRPGTA